MEALFSEQQATGKQIETICSNFSKDGPQRWNQAYLLKRISQLNMEWNRFRIRHQQIESNKETHMKEEYFTKKYFENIEGLYSKYCEKMLKELDSLPSSGTKGKMATESLEGASKEVATGKGQLSSDIVRHQRASIKAMMRLTQQSADLDEEQKSRAFYTKRLEMIKAYWELIVKGHQQILSLDDIDDYSEEEFFRVEDEYLKASVSFQEGLDSLENSEKETEVKLPRITLPTFNGQYSRWIEFKDLYTELIHKRNINGAQKLHYLKANLVGEPSKLLQHFSTTDANYKAAWNTLIDRYDNKRLLVTALLNDICQQGNITTESAGAIKRLLDTTKECMSAISNIGIDVATWDPIVLHLILQKLDKESRRLYEQSLKSSKELQSLEDLYQFLTSRYQTIEAISSKEDRKRVTSLMTSSTEGCVVCQMSGHNITNCRQFFKKNYSSRCQLVKQLQLCFNCLQKGHRSHSCTLSVCKRCNKRHHSLLHPEPSSSNKNNTSLKANKFQSCEDEILLATAIVNIVNQHGTTSPCRAVLDSGSQLHFISERMCQELGLPRTRINMPIAGIGSTEVVAKTSTTLLVQSHTTCFQTTIEAIVLPKISEAQPTVYLETKNWNIPSHVTLADPEFNRPQRIDLLLGAELYLKLIISGQIEIGPALPTLQNTRLGWIVAGRANTKTSDSYHKSRKLCSIAIKHGTSSLEKQIERFWELEQHVEENTPISTEEMTCETHFQDTVKRHKDGRFIVQLPFKTNPDEIGHSEAMAMKRFLSLEKKLVLNPKLQEQYKLFMKEYEDEGHMTRVARCDVSQQSQFIPHHGVIKADSSTTKLRVVFDASAKTLKGASLNQAMMVGPTVQSDLFTVLVKFRLNQYAFAADVKQMYRQILVDENHRKYQMIFWRPSPSEPIRTYRLNTVTYGTAAAPYLATRCLKQLAEENLTRTPRAAQVVIEETYVDDILTGADTLEEAIKLREQLISMLAQGKFELRKFCANDPEILKGIPKDHQEKTMSMHQRDVVKTLGLIWEPIKDIFFFSCPPNFGESNKLTKRVAYAEISRLFDPLGIIGPVVVLGKLFMQELWKSKTAWDDPLTQELRNKWEAYKVQLYALSKISIPRCSIAQQPSDIQLHAFSDSSMSAFGACCYIRSIDSQGNIMVSLLCAKSRVAPLKTTTLARLELCAAVLMAEMVERLLKILTVPISQVHYYTDSKTVLSWISSPSYTWETFVANRVARIQSLSNQNNWHHIAGKNNPADLISRGLPATHLLDATIWFNGPAFLRTPEDSWPQSHINILEEVPERRTSKSALMSTWKGSSICELSTPVHRQDSIRRLQRIFSYCLRFINNARSVQTERIKGRLTQKEMILGLEGLLRNTQIVAFSKEYKQLTDQTSIDHSSKLLTLQPFIDSKGLLRVGGRLRNSDLNTTVKHPILLPKRSQVTQLILKDIHLEHMHTGPQSIVALSRQKYWIIDVKRAATEIVRNCIRCFRVKPTPIHQIMGDLPRERVTPSRPFLHTGVDFAGPLKIYSKIRGRAAIKGYMAVFVCFTTKAVHLEVVSDLTTEAFLNALKRFMSRRGYCASISCDNATNFVGAKSELSRLHDLFESQKLKTELHQYCQAKEIDWKFIPPRSPHFGGLWEAAVKSAKQLLIRYTGMTALTYEELNTILTQIEAILNSRPITPISNDPNDLEALTPGHFLIGEALCSFPEPDVSDKNIDHLRRFQRIQCIQQKFWKRWSAEYITQLQNRFKWKTNQANIMPGTMVIISDDNAPPLKWPLGKIVKVHHGEDNVVRVVDVKTKGGIFKRAITRICPLPGQENESNGNERTSELKIDKEIRDSSSFSESLSRSGEKRKLNSGTAFMATKRNRIQSERVISNITTKPTRIYPINTRWLENPAAMTRRSTNPKITATNILTTALVVLFCMFPGNATSVTSSDNTSPVIVKQINSTAGIYFEQLGQTKLITDEWNIVVYHNTSMFIQELKGLHKALENMGILCERTLYYTTNCRITLNELQYQYKTALEMNGVIQSQNHIRTRRSPLDVVGMVANKLFGVMDQEHADMFEKDIEHLNKNQKYLFDLTKRQTTVLNSTLNMLEIDQKHTDSQLQSLSEHFQHIQKAYNVATKKLDETRAMLLFNSMVNIVSLSFARYQRIQSAIIDSITDAHHGKINTLILTPAELTRQLQTIKLHLPISTALPSEDLRTLYSLTKISTRITERGIVFNIKIPLVHETSYELYKVIPLPTVINNKLTYVNPTSEYIAITLQRNRYVKFGIDDINKCDRSQGQTYICTGRHPVYNYKENDTPCELNFFNHIDNPYSGCTLGTVNEKQVWIQLQKPNTWVFSTIGSSSINVICGNQVYPTEIHGQGELTMQDKCLLETKVATIYSFKYVKTNASAPFIPFTNISFHDTENNGQSNPTMKPLPALVFEHNYSYTQLKGQLIDQQQIETISAHDLHQFSLLYGSLLIFALYAIYRWWKRPTQKMMTQAIKPQAVKAEERFTVEVE